MDKVSSERSHIAKHNRVFLYAPYRNTDGVSSHCSVLWCVAKLFESVLFCVVYVVACALFLFLFFVKFLYCCVCGVCGVCV